MTDIEERFAHNGDNGSLIACALVGFSERSVSSAVSERLIPTGERSGLRTRIATTERVLLRIRVTFPLPSLVLPWIQGSFVRHNHYHSLPGTVISFDQVGHISAKRQFKLGRPFFPLGEGCFRHAHDFSNVFQNVGNRSKPRGHWQPFTYIPRGDGKRFIVRADEMLTAFVELERQVLTVTFYLESIHDDSRRDQ